MPLTVQQEAQLRVEAAQGDPQAQAILARDRAERESAVPVAPGGQPQPTPFMGQPPPNQFGSQRPQADPNIAPLNPLMQEPPPPREMGPDPYGGYPMQPPQASPPPPSNDPLLDPNNPWNLGGTPGSSGLGPSPEPGVGGIYPPGPGPVPPPPAPIPPAPIPPYEEPPDLYGIGPRPQPPGAPGAQPPGPRYMGSNPQPFTGAPGTPATPATPAPPVNFNSMNGITPPGLPGFRLPPATVTEAATDPDRQGRSDWGDDLVMLGLGMMAGADNPGASLFGALGTGGLAMMANRRERERGASEAAERALTREDRRYQFEVRMQMQQQGFDRDDARFLAEQAGLNARAAAGRADRDDDPSERAQDFYEEWLGRSHTIREPPLDENGNPFLGADPIERDMTPEEIVASGRRFAREIDPNFMAGEGLPLPEDASELVDNEIYATAQGPLRWHADPNHPDGGEFR